VQARFRERNKEMREWGIIGKGEGKEKGIGNLASKTQEGAGPSVARKVHLLCFHANPVGRCPQKMFLKVASRCCCFM